MGTKTEPGEFDCYAALLPDEPFFLLAGRDPEAPFLIRAWARQREREINEGRRPVEDRPKVAEARQLADQMEVWRAANDGKWRKPAPEFEEVPAAEVLPPA